MGHRQATIKVKYPGHSTDEEAAARAHGEASLGRRGDFGRTNFPVAA